jgi:hypothetical protein
MLDVWPALPLVLLCDSAYPIDNIVAVLEHSNRVRQIELFEVSNSSLKKTLAATQVPFPELTDLVLMSYEETARVLPDSFLGGSAPSLRRLVEWRPISGIAETASVGRSPRRSYFLENSSFRILLTRGHAHCLSTLTSLQYLWLEFKSP